MYSNTITHACIGTNIKSGREGCSHQYFLPYILMNSLLDFLSLVSDAILEIPSLEDLAMLMILYC